ncbi:MAG TPA: hypothetical protein VFJ90_16050 [Candidatus Didemnitutus sp.]|nr:hypothetical protein [Candidatus Didemnitutus sp.]
MHARALRYLVSAFLLMIVSSGRAADASSTSKLAPTQAALRRESEDLDRKRPQLEARIQAEKGWLEKLNGLLSSLQSVTYGNDYALALGKLEKILGANAPAGSAPTAGTTPASANTSQTNPTAGGDFRQQSDDVYRLVYALILPVDTAVQNVTYTNPSAVQSTDPTDREETELTNRLNREYGIAYQTFQTDYANKVGFNSWASQGDLQAALKIWRDDATVKQWFTSYRDSVAAAVKRERDATVQLVGKNERELKDLNDRAAQIDGLLIDTQNSLDQALVNRVMPVFAGVVVVLLLIPILYRNPEAQDSILRSGMVVELITIYLLVSSILILGFANKLEKETLSTLLGGISGYVLGRIGQRQTIAALTGVGNQPPGPTALGPKHAPAAPAPAAPAPAAPGP